MFYFVFAQKLSGINQILIFILYIYVLSIVKHLGKTIKNLRLQNTKTVIVVAGYLCMSECNYRKIESEEISISIDNLSKLARFYNTNIEEILLLNKMNTQKINISESFAAGGGGGAHIF